MDDVSLNFETDLPDEKPSFTKQYQKAILLLLVASIAIFLVVFVILKNTDNSTDVGFITPTPTIEVTIIPTMKPDLDITPETNMPTPIEDPIKDPLEKPDKYSITCNATNTECYLNDSFSQDETLIRKCNSGENLMKCQGIPTEFEPSVLGYSGNYVYLIQQTTEVCNCGIEGEVYRFNSSNKTLNYMAYATDSEILIENPDLSEFSIPENCKDVTKESTYTYQCLQLINPEFYGNMTESEAEDWIERNKENTINYYLYIHPYIQV